MIFLHSRRAPGWWQHVIVSARIISDGTRTVCDRSPTERCQLRDMCRDQLYAGEARLVKLSTKTCLLLRDRIGVPRGRFFAS